MTKTDIITVFILFFIFKKCISSTGVEEKFNLKYVIQQIRKSLLEYFKSTISSLEIYISF